MHAARFHDRDHAVEESHLADEVGITMQAAIGIHIANRIRLHRYLRLDRGLEQVGMERQHRALRRGRALGEEGDTFAIMDALHQTFVDAAHVARLAACDEDRTGVLAQPANQGPAADIGLRDKAAWVHRIDHEDIQPGNMVADDQRRRHWRRQQAVIHLHGDAADCDQLLRPALHAPLAGGGAEEGKQHADLPQTDEQVQRKTRQREQRHAYVLLYARRPDTKVCRTWPCSS